MSAPDLVVEAARDMSLHDHRRLGHGQTGNSLYPWHRNARLACPLCVALLVHDGADVSWEFRGDLPHELGPGGETDWWTRVYLDLLPHVPDRDDRDEMRTALAYAIRAGRAAHARWLARSAS